MKKVILILMIICFCSAQQPAVASHAAQGAPAGAKKKVKKGKKKIPAKDLRQRAQRDMKQHEAEARQRDYLQMQEAQRRGMQMQGQNHQ